LGIPPLPLFYTVQFPSLLLNTVQLILDLILSLILSISLAFILTLSITVAGNGLGIGLGFNREQRLSKGEGKILGFF